MGTTRQLGLSTFDGQLLDGLDFCRKAYDLFDQVSGGPDGIAKLRLRPTNLQRIWLARYSNDSRARATKTIRRGRCWLSIALRTALSTILNGTTRLSEDQG